MVETPKRSLILETLGLLLEPIVLLLLKSGVTWKEFASVARAKFVEVATREFGIRGRPTNVSRVAILTGLDRRDVAKLRVPATTDTQPGFMSRPTQVLEGWYGDLEFLTPGSTPRDLEIDRGGNDFAALVRRYAPGIPVVAMVKELSAAGAIEKTKSGKLRALKRSFIPRELGDNQLRLWGSALRDLGTTLENNVARAKTDPARFERRALNLNVDPRALPDFKAFLETEGQAFLERVDAWLLAHRIDDQDATGSAGIRLGVGVYHIQDARNGVGSRP
jgi:hypothetical protein